jgi:hypothetical protein
VNDLTDLPNVFRSLIDDIHKTSIWGYVWECLITYQGNCQDGTFRNVELKIRDLCGGDDSESLSYRAPMDSSSQTFAQFRMKGPYVAGEDIFVPVVLTYPDSVYFYSGEVSFQYNNELLDFVDIETRGTPFISQQLGVTHDSDRVTVRYTFPAIGRTDEVIFVLVFRRKVTVEYPVTLHLQIVDWYADRSYCISGKIIPEEITIDPLNIGTFAPYLARTFDITPNPNNGAFDVALEFEKPTAFTMRIVNVAGRSVYTESVADRKTTYHRSISLGDAPPGVYFFLVESRNRYDYRKVVVNQ